MSKIDLREIERSILQSNEVMFKIKYKKKNPSSESKVQGHEALISVIASLYFQRMSGLNTVRRNASLAGHTKSGNPVLISCRTSSDSGANHVLLSLTFYP